MMKYSNLVKLRAENLYYQGELTYREYKGTSWFKKYHVCWYVCVNDRDDHWKCEECGKWDKMRKPYYEC